MASLTLSERADKMTEALNKYASANTPNYPLFLSLCGVKKVSDLLPLLEENVKSTENVTLDDLEKKGINPIVNHLDAFNLRRDCYRRYASRYALLRKGIDSKFYSSTTLSAKEKVNGKQ